MAELWYRLNKLPDLTLSRYASLEDSGVGGVLEKHIAFLRLLNRKGIVSAVSFHLFYLYIVPAERERDRPGHRLQILLMIRGSEAALESVPALIKASPLSDFYPLEQLPRPSTPEDPAQPLRDLLAQNGEPIPAFPHCALLAKSETMLPAAVAGSGDYYMLRAWEMNEDGRLYSMCKMMEALNRTALYRVDLYPVEKSAALRASLRKPMSILRQRQEERGSRRDYDGKDALDCYDDLIEQYESSPHFIANIAVFAGSREDAVSILDAAGAESLMKGKYRIAPFAGSYHPLSFLVGYVEPQSDLREGVVLRQGDPGLIVCRSDTAQIDLNYLPTLFSLEEIAPFFRFPALYDGEVIQIAKETAPEAVGEQNALCLGKDTNGYDVFFPLSLLPKHAFVSGVPGSGKTNTMHHITSSLWKQHRIPFLVLEPAKQEYRALANDPGMEEMYLFSPNADMSFPLHINPFEMPKGTMVSEHIRRLCSVFEGAFPLEPPMPFLLDTAIEAVYRELGWIPEHVYTGTEKTADGRKKRPLPTVSMLYRRLEQELNETNYSDDVRGNLESALKVRIGSLLRREMGDIFDVPESTFEPEKWLTVPAVIELESMGTGPANFLTLMLCSLIRETLKANPLFEGDIRHVIFIEEAHNLIGPESEEQSGLEADPKRAATAFVVKMLAEVRALKEGIVIADQLPTVMAQEVLKNTGLKIGLRITSADDRSLLGSTMAASGMQLEAMSTFAVGEALIFYEKLMRPFTVRVREWWGELGNTPEKEAMTQPKNDAALRDALAEHDSFQNENTRSIVILTEKFGRMMTEQLPAVRQCSKRINKIAELKQRCFRIDMQCLQIAKAVAKVTPETAEGEKRLYDERARLQLRVDQMCEDEHENGEAAGYIRSMIGWIRALDRLINGRWKRFSAESPRIISANRMKGAIYAQLKALYLNYSATVGLTEEERTLQTDMEDVSRLCEG